MANSTLPNRLRINGLIDTNRPVVDNMVKIARNAGCWISYDNVTGKWGVVINKPESSVKTFDDSNIVGPIKIFGTDMTDSFTDASIKFPLRDNNDQTDTIRLQIPLVDRNTNEPARELESIYELVNEPVQAQLLGLIELKQSRTDLSIQFTADYSTINVQAGDIIAVTNELYGFTGTLFRVIMTKEVDSQDQGLIVEFTCTQYDPNIYDETDLNRYIRSDRTGINGAGTIGKPISAPTLTTTNVVDAVPRIRIQGQVPNGVIEEIEIWYSFDNIDYLKSNSVGQINPVGGIWTPGDTFDVDQTFGSSGFIPNFYVKFRGKNSQTTGPFSPVASVTNVDVIQLTDALGNATPVTNSAGTAFTDLSGNTITSGSLAYIAQSLLGNLSSSALGNAITSFGEILKDSGAPLFDTTSQFGGLFIENSTPTNIYTDINTYAGTANINGYQGSSTTLGSNLYYTATKTLSYNAEVITIDVNLPGGSYDYEAYDPVTDSTYVVSNTIGYVPTQLALTHRAPGEGTDTGIYVINTNVDTPSISTTVYLGMINTARINGGKSAVSSMAGTLKVGFAVSPYAYQPGLYNNLTGDDRIYPYNWSAFSDTLPNIILTIHQGT